MTKYAVMIEVDEGEWMYLSHDNPFTYYSKPCVFDTKQEADDAASKWNTGWVVEYNMETV
jgi:hypothetical protein